jgi:hypothetical protein
VALVLSTMSAAVAAGGTVYIVYFACVPTTTLWRDLPEYTVDAYVTLLSLAGLVAGFVALARHNSRRLCTLALLISGWLFVFSALQGSTF